MFCTQRGARLPAGARFCPNRDAPVQAAPVQPQPPRSDQKAPLNVRAANGCIFGFIQLLVWIYDLVVDVVSGAGALFFGFASAWPGALHAGVRLLCAVFAVLFATAFIWQFRRNHPRR